MVNPPPPLRAPEKHGAASAWIIVLLALLVCVAGFFGVRELTRPPALESNGEAAPVITVEVEPAKMTAWKETVELTGTVEATDRLQIGSEVGGLKIVEVLVEEGDRVRQGQLLARLNTSLLAARLDQLQARYTQQQAAVAKARRPQRPLEIAQLESAVHQAQAGIDQEKANLTLSQAALRNARANLDRYSNLYSEGAVPEVESENRLLEVQRQEAQVRAAEQRIEAASFAAKQARERLQLAESGGRAEDVVIAESQLRELQAQIDEVQAQIEQAHITAPSDGWVLVREAHLGDIASPGAVLFEIARGGQLQLSATVSETALAGIEPGMDASVVYGGKNIQASVDRITPQVDPQTRNAEVILRLPLDSGLQPGMFASASIELGAREQITVPLEAVLGESPEYYVYVLDGRSAKRVGVEIGGRRDGKASVVEGLKLGTEVITEGGGFLRDGDPVARS
ncbi:MAG: efflux RND transporter periplasmic adaptor subunit [Vulcanimicrobiota bacterium]